MVAKPIVVRKCVDRTSGWAAFSIWVEGMPITVWNHFRTPAGFSLTWGELCVVPLDLLDGWIERELAAHGFKAEEVEFDGLTNDEASAFLSWVAGWNKAGYTVKVYG